jgi:hypothetical protein
VLPRRPFFAQKAATIGSCAKYLGFFIGPGAGNQDWDRVLDKVCQLSKFIRELGLPKFFSLYLFQMFGVSQVQFVAQLRVPPKKIGAVDVKIVRDWIGGPGLWAPCNLFRNLKSVGFPIEIVSLRVAARATLTRASLTTLKSHRLWTDRLDNSSHFLSDSAYVHHPNEVWRDSCAVLELRKAVMDIHGSDFDLQFSEGGPTDWTSDKHMQNQLTNRFNKHFFSLLMSRHSGRGSLADGSAVKIPVCLPAELSR